MSRGANAARNTLAFKFAEIFYCSIVILVDVAHENELAGLPLLALSQR